MSKAPRALLKLQADLAKSYGERAAMFVSDMPKSRYVSTGSLALDFAVGTGGFPTNRVVEIAGGEGAGKTTLALLTMAHFLDEFPDKGAIILDLEHKLSDAWVEKLVGAERSSRVILLWPDTIEEATDMYTKACKTGQICYALLDSIGGAPTQRVFNKTAESGNIGGNALGVTRFAQFASVFSSKYDVCTVGINQAREDMSGYNRHVTPGGRGWKHACILRIQLKRGKGKYFAEVDGEKLQIGYSVVAKTVKNQMAAPFRVGWWPFYNVETEEYGFGIDRISEISRLSISVGVVKQRGAWYYHDQIPDGKLKSQSRLVDFMRENEDFRELVAKQVIEAVAERGLSTVAPAGQEGEIVEGEGDSHIMEEILLGEDSAEQLEEEGEE